MPVERDLPDKDQPHLVCRVQNLQAVTFNTEALPLPPQEPAVFLSLLHNPLQELCTESLSRKRGEG